MTPSVSKLLENKSMPNQILPIQVEDAFLSVKGAAALIHSTPQSVYVLICRKRFPEHLYIRLGRKVLFIRKNLIDWLLSGAKLEG